MIYLICCYTGKYFDNVNNVLFNIKNLNFCKVILINQTNKSINFTNNSITEILIDKMGVSVARNIGLKIAKELSYNSNDIIYFWDEDIFIHNEILENIYSQILNNFNFDAIVFKIRSVSNKPVGNTPFFITPFLYFNKFRLGNPCFFFKLNKINIFFNELIGPGKSNIIACEDSLFIFENNLNNFITPFPNLCLIHPEPEEINNYKKIFKYSISQGAVVKSIKFPDNLFFSYFILIRPIFGIFLKPKMSKFYKLRIKYFINGYKKGLNF